MVIKYQLSPYPTLMEDFVVKVWESANTAPGAEVYTLVVPQAGGGGHPNIETITINGLDKVTHMVRLYTAISNNKLHEYNVEPVADLLTYFTPKQFKIGTPQVSIVVPNAGDTFYGDGDLGAINQEDYTVFRNNYGYLIPDLHYTHIPTSGFVLGGFELVAPDQFQQDEEFTIQIKPVLQAPIHDSVVGKWFGGFHDIVADESFGPGVLRQLHRFNNGAKFTFPVGVGVPIGYGFCFQNFGSSATTSKVVFLNAPLKWGNTTKTEIDIPAYCEGMFVYDGAMWHVVYLSQSTWVNAASPTTPGQNVGIGTTHLGNVAVGDFLYDITHGLGIAGDYLVFLSCQGTAATAGKDDDIQISWYHHPTNKANQFKAMIGFPNGSVGHDVTLCWLIVKI